MARRILWNFLKLVFNKYIGVILFVYLVIFLLSTNFFSDVSNNNQQFKPININPTLPTAAKKNSLTLPFNNEIKSDQILLRDFKFKSDDTLIISFQKSGTIWVKHLVWLIKNDLDIERLKSNEKYLISYMHKYVNPNKVKNIASPRVFNTHERIHNLPQNFTEIIKSVYVVRNVKDVLVSYFHFFIDWKPYAQQKFNSTSIDAFCELFLSGYSNLAWCQHVNEYSSVRNIHIIHYEDLIEEPEKTVKELASYLEVDLSDSQIKSVIKLVSFDSMKNNFSNINRRAKSWTGDRETIYYRNGKIGDWKEHLSVEMSNRIDEFVARNLIYNKTFKYEPTLEKN